jgi:hypothetical protein
MSHGDWYENRQVFDIQVEVVLDNPVFFERR